MVACGLGFFFEALGLFNSPAAPTRVFRFAVAAGRDFGCADALSCRCGTGASSPSTFGTAPSEISSAAHATTDEREPFFASGGKSLYARRAC